MQITIPAEFTEEHARLAIETAILNIRNSSMTEEEKAAMMTIINQLDRDSMLKLLSLENKFGPAVFAFCEYYANDMARIWKRRDVDNLLVELDLIPSDLGDRLTTLGHEILRLLDCDRTLIIDIISKAKAPPESQSANLSLDTAFSPFIITHLSISFTPGGMRGISACPEPEPAPS